MTPEHCTCTPDETARHRKRAIVAARGLGIETVIDIVAGKHKPG